MSQPRIRDERDDPAERQGAGDGRIDQRRGRGHGEPERRPLRPGADNTFTSAGANVYPRLYHSGSLLLPDATVLLIGGNPQRGTYEPHIEIYSPAYLFNADGSRPRGRRSRRRRQAERCRLRRRVPGADAGRGARSSFGRPGAAGRADPRVRHGSAARGAVVHRRERRAERDRPPNGNIAPPGYYMLFVLNTAGVPSVAKFVRLPVPGATKPATHGCDHEPVDGCHGSGR